MQVCDDRLHVRHSGSSSAHTKSPRQLGFRDTQILGISLELASLLEQHPNNDIVNV